MDQPTILIADSDFGDVAIEQAIVEGAGFRLAAAQCKSEDDVIAYGRDADGILTQYATVGARAIDECSRCALGDARVDGDAARRDRSERRAHVGIADIGIVEQLHGAQIGEHHEPVAARQPGRRRIETRDGLRR